MNMCDLRKQYFLSDEWVSLNEFKLLLLKLSMQSQPCPDLGQCGVRLLTTSCWDVFLHFKSRPLVMPHAQIGDRLPFAKVLALLWAKISLPFAAKVV